MKLEGFNGRKREVGPYALGRKMKPCWGIVNMQMYVDGAFDCFVKEVPANDDDSGYMTYECGYEVSEASMYSSAKQARDIIRVYRMSDRVYQPIKVEEKVFYTVDPEGEFTNF